MKQVRKIIIFIFINSEKLGWQIRKPKDKITVPLYVHVDINTIVRITHQDHKP